MSFDLMLWRRRPASRRTRGFIYRVLSAGVPCDGVEPIDAEAVARDMDAAEPGWRTDGSRLTVDVSVTSIEVSIAHGEGGDRALEVIQGLASRHGLELFDPQGEEVSAKDEREAAKYLESVQDSIDEEQVGVWMRAAASGDPDAMNELGGAYSWGECVREDAVIAAQWYARAAARGHRIAMANLAECCRSGEGVRHDPAMAIRLFEQSGALGNLEALVRLAELSRAGDGLPKDAAAARRALERAAEKDRQVSVFMLAEMLEAGEGGDRDLERAKELYQVALNNRHPEARLRLRRLGVDA
jgi:TPR repeat protein